MIYLDTHVVIWLYEGLTNKLSSKAKRLIDTEEIIVSAMVDIEMQFLHEVEKITKSAETILFELQQSLGLHICQMSLNQIARFSEKVNWTRDPFDRIIVSNAMAAKSHLLTRDKEIGKHCDLVVW